MKILYSLAAITTIAVLVYFRFSFFIGIIAAIAVWNIVMYGVPLLLGLIMWVYLKHKNKL